MTAPRRSLAWLIHAALTLALAGCLDHRDPPEAVAACARCHGSPERAGDALTKAAPPADLSGNTDPAYPGVGAHSIHLEPGATHGAIACNTCHRVPDDVATPGHADDALPAEVLLAAGAYDYARHGCAGTDCHRAATQEWTRPRTSVETCGSCHGLPPPPPHPASEACDRCHGEVIAADRSFVAPDKHVDGEVEVEVSCHACHGTPASPAPPPDLGGGSDRGRIGVGAHEAHLAGGAASRPVPCESCHVVPADVSDAGHLDAAPAEVTFAGTAVAGGREPTWDRSSRNCAASFCHGPSSPDAPPSPSWTSPGPLACSSCHGLPPPPPHPQLEDCVLCHGAVVDAARAIVARELHVDGVVAATPPTTCDACHGSGPLGAPPPALDGQLSWSVPGVGAHATHLGGTGSSRPVTCGECHQVPATVLAPGHLDSARPAELSFSGVAVAYGAVPSYDGTSCAQSFCHGDSFFGQPSGGSLTTPQWTGAPGTQTFCGSCHGLPPPAPHPDTAVAPCSDCHGDIAPNYVFVDPARHVDGVVDF